MSLRSSLLCLMMLSVLPAVACDKKEEKKAAKDDDDDDDEPKKKKKDDKTSSSASASASGSKDDKPADTAAATATAAAPPTAEPAAPASATAATTTGGSCDAYFAALDCMTTKVPAGSQAEMKKSFDDVKKTMKELPPDISKTACSEALKGMEASLKSLGCSTAGGAETAAPVVGGPPPAPPSTSWPPPIPSGKSAVPTTEEWNAQTREVTVLGSGKLNCETKQVREWIRVSCKGKNDTGGEATGVKVTKGGGRGDDFVFASGGVASLVYRFYEGQSLEAEFKWTDKTKTLVVAWPNGAPEPPARGAFK